MGWEGPPAMEPVFVSPAIEAGWEVWGYTDSLGYWTQYLRPAGDAGINWQWPVFDLTFVWPDLLQGGDKWGIPNP